MKNIIEIENLSFEYENKKVLDKITVSFKEKKLYCLIGASGCGKSTFIKCLNKMFLELDQYKIQGEIFFNGKNILNSTVNVNALRKEIQMVFQTPIMFPMNIYKNISFPLECHNCSNIDEVVLKSLKQVGIYEEVKQRLKSSAHTLSGGQKQRLAIARCIALNPKVLLLDEPTSALDEKSASTIERLLLELKNKMCVIMVTHNIEQAKRIADQILVFENGKIKL